MKAQYNYLYVEDDPLNRKVLQILLVEVMGVKNLTIFEDSRDFMERLRALSPRPDFILLDIHVEPYDGYKLLRMLRGDPEYAGVKVVAVTASVMVEEIGQLQAEGFDGAFGKPLDMLTFPDLFRRLEAGETIWQMG